MSVTTPPTREHSHRPGMLERPSSRGIRQEGPGTRLRGRPELYTQFTQDMALLNTPGKRIGVGALVLLAFLFVFVLPDNLVTLLSTAFVLAIGALALNIVTGYCGQVSLGHAFFIGLGAYAGTVTSAAPGGSTLGFGLSLFPLPYLAAAVVAGVAGLVVAPLALRLKGLYLAIVTLGLVFVGEHLFKEARFLTGGPGVGRSAVELTLPGVAPQSSGPILGVHLAADQKLYLLVLLLLIASAVMTRNLARSDLGRSFSAVRDRDIAAEVIGVDLTRAKVIAFGLSSALAGVTGALLYTLLQQVEPSRFNLLLSIQFVAMILIGGVATVSGSILGALFIGTLGRVSFELAELLPESVGLSGELLEGILYGVLIISFLILEPRGLFGIWVRIRNYWKAWPFSY